MKTQKVCLGIKIICQLDKQVQVLSSCEHSSQALRDSICHVMSLSVTAYPFPWSRGVLLLEPISALSQDEGRVLPGQVRALTDEQCGIQYLTQRHFDMWLSPARNRDLNQRPSDH